MGNREIKNWMSKRNSIKNIKQEQIACLEDHKSNKLNKKIMYIFKNKNDEN